LNYIKTLLKDDLIPGSDWRDTRLDLDDKTVLSNACQLYKAYKVLNQEDEAQKIKKIIQERFWNGKYFIDYPSMEKNISCSNNFDILGNSLSILNDIASE